MKTYRAVEAADRLIAFEIPNSTPALVARILRGVEGVTDVRVRRLFGPFPQDVHVRFRFRGLDHVVMEPWGDSSRLWIGPENTGAPAADASALEEAFKEWRSPVWRRLGNVIARLSAKQ